MGSDPRMTRSAFQDTDAGGGAEKAVLGYAPPDSGTSGLMTTSQIKKKRRAIMPWVVSTLPVLAHEPLSIESHDVLC